MIAQIQMRRGTTAEWAAASPVVLAAGEPGWDSTLEGMKVGDGSTEWAALPWIDAKNRPDINAATLDGVHLADIRLGQNILHNWDFRNPVNQRGVLTASGGGYWLDRWTLLHTNGATYTYNSSWGLRAITTTADIRMHQYIENPNAYAGKTVTLSVDIYSASVTANCNMRLWYNGTTQIGALLPIYNGNTGIKSLTATIPDTELTDLSVVFYNNSGNEVRIKRVKLELGTGSTLHLDPPMDHAVELPKCQRFLMPFLVGVAMAGYTNSSESAVLLYPTPVQMRINPTLPPNAEVTCFGESKGAFNAIPSTIVATASGVRLIVNTSGLTAWKPLTGFPRTSTFLSSEL